MSAPFSFPTVMYGMRDFLSASPVKPASEAYNRHETPLFTKYRASPTKTKVISAG